MQEYLGSIIAPQPARLRRALALVGAAGSAGTLTVATPAAAQTWPTAPTQTDEIVVIGERPASNYSTNEAVSFGYSPLAITEVPQSLQVLTRDLIDDQGVLSLSELLNNVAGASNSLGRSTPFGTASTRIPARSSARTASSAFLRLSATTSGLC